MDPDALIASLQQALPGVQLERAPSTDLQTTIYVSRDDVSAVARVLHDAPDLAFTFLAELTAADFWPREPRFEVIYILVSITHRLRLRMKVRQWPKRLSWKRRPQTKRHARSSKQSKMSESQTWSTRRRQRK